MKKKIVTTETPLGAQYVPIAPGLFLPVMFEGQAQIEGMRVRLSIYVSPSGPRVDALTIEHGWNENGVTGELLRKVPVATLAHEAIRAALVLIDAENQSSLHGAYQMIDAFSKTTAKEWPKGDLESVFRAVAITYRVADAVGEGPTAAVAKAMNVSRATAGRMVSEARANGYLSKWGPRFEKIDASPKTLEEWLRGNADPFPAVSLNGEHQETS